METRSDELSDDDASLLAHEEATACGAELGLLTLGAQPDHKEITDELSDDDASLPTHDKATACGDELGA